MGCIDFVNQSACFRAVWPSRVRGRGKVGIGVECDATSLDFAYNPEIFFRFYLLVQ